MLTKLSPRAKGGKLGIKSCSWDPSENQICVASPDQMAEYVCAAFGVL